MVPSGGGKGSLYEGGTRVAAVAAWPGHIPAGAVLDQPIQSVDMYPTLARLAGASPSKDKPLDGIDVWSVMAEGQPSPRKEVVYDIEPFRAALRQGDWKLIWQTSLPSKVELFNLRQDPGEKVNLADSNSAKVGELQQRIQLLSQDAVQPLVLKESFGVLKSVFFGSVALPAEENALEKQP